MNKNELEVLRVADEAARLRALEVLRRTYRDEKHWVRSEEQQFPAGDLGRDDVAWFLACEGDEPVGVLRVLYDPPLHLYREYGLKLLHDALDVEAFIRDNRIAEIGRFAVLAARRRRTGVALGLIREAIADTVRRGYSHYVTDVFEGEEHSPYEFHTRVLGFQPVATHDTGELECAYRRITLVLDLRETYRRMRSEGGFFFRYMTDGWEAELHRRLGGDGAADETVAPARRRTRAASAATSLLG